MAKFEKCVKKVFFGCPQFRVPPGSGCLCKQMVDMTVGFNFFLAPYMLTIVSMSFGFQFFLNMLEC